MLKYPCRPAPSVQALAMLLLCAGFHSAQATLIVNPPLPITHRVDVQIIQTSLDDGSQPANVFGNAAQRASIEASIDAIWAQAGIDIYFLPDITPYANSFAYQGTTPPEPPLPLDVDRSGNDIYSIINKAQTAGIWNPDLRVINMFFVDITPGFKKQELGANAVAGLAQIGGNGIAAFVGSNKLNTQNGNDAIAGVIAHEIGHNLNLSHTTPNIANLMSPQGTSDQMSQMQINAVLAFNPFYLQEVPLMGDFTGDGMVNEADLNVWKGAYGISANGDGDRDGDSDGMDFLDWQRSFGSSSGLLPTSYAVPEPATSLLLLMAAGAICSRKIRFAL